MKLLYLVNLSANLDREAVIRHLNSLSGYGTWFYSMPSSFFIYSRLMANEICDTIRNKFGENERVFVVRVTDSDYQGWMPKSHWTIINNKGAEKRYDLSFNGYYLDSKFLISTSGVYCVYRCVYSSVANNVIVNQLLYIGQAIDVRKRHENHERLRDWQQRLLPGEQLCYTCAEVAKVDLDRVESSLIFLNKPICNDKGKDAFGYFDTYVSVVGASLLLKSDVIAEQTK